MEAGIQSSIAMIIATNMSVALANTENNFDFLSADFSLFEANLQKYMYFKYTFFVKSQHS